MIFLENPGLQDKDDHKPNQDEVRPEKESKTAKSKFQGLVDAALLRCDVTDKSKKSVLEIVEQYKKSGDRNGVRNKLQTGI